MLTIVDDCMNSYTYHHGKKFMIILKNCCGRCYAHAVGTSTCALGCSFTSTVERKVTVGYKIFVVQQERILLFRSQAINIAINIEPAPEHEPKSWTL